MLCLHKSFGIDNFLCVASNAHSEMKRILWGICLALLLSALPDNVKGQTTVFFDVQQVFTTQPPDNTNRVFRIQSLSPFAGQFFYRTSDVAGQFYVSNCLATTYAGTMLAPPSSVSFSFTITATNLGVVPAQGITSIPQNSIGTYPSGQTAWSVQASDNRYAPKGSGPFSALTAAQSTNLVQGATNGQTSIVYSNANVFVNTNLLFVTSNALAISAGISALTVTNIASNTVWSATNTYSSIVTSNGNVYVNTNLLFNTSNALASISSAGISALTATNIASNQVFGATNTINITSGLSAFVPTNRFDIAGAATSISNYFQSQIPDVIITNGSSTATIQAQGNSVTNGVVKFAPGNYAITSNLLFTNGGTFIGYGATLSLQIGLTGAMISNGTNSGKRLAIIGFTHIGGANNTFNDGSFFLGINGFYVPFYNNHWTNRYALRLESSGGVLVADNQFFGWSGGGCFAISHGGTLTAQGTPKFSFINNICATNFAGVYLPAASYEYPGYYNSDPSLWNQVDNPEYAQIQGNNIYRNNFGVVASAGNAIVQNNNLDFNYVGLALFSGNNPMHGNYTGNTINHNTLAAYWEGDGTGGLFVDNNMLANTSVVGHGITDLVFKQNNLGQTALIFTNGCTGHIEFNTWQAANVWGVGIPTNFTGSPAMIISGNISTDGTNTDGSSLSLLIVSNTLPQSALPAAVITNAYGTNLPTGLVVGHVLYYPTNDLSVTSNALSAAIALKADTNSPTIFTPLIKGGTLDTVTNNNIYFTGGASPGTYLGGTSGGIVAAPFGGGGLFQVLGNMRGTNIQADGHFIGNGFGITNAGTTNIQGAGLAQVTNIVNALSPSVNSNALLFAGKMDSTNGFSTGQTASNLVVQGGMGFGPSGLSTNIIGNTNFLAFVNSGSGIMTNGAFIWDTAVGQYTNWLTGAVVTNTGSSWVSKTNAVSLYSIAGSSPNGQYSQVSGASPAPLAVFSAAINDHMIMLGYWSVSNQLSISNNIVTNMVTIVSSNAIASTNGFGIGTVLTNPVVTWNSAIAVNSAVNGGAMNFQAMSAGQANTNTGSGGGAAILSGFTNRLSLSGASVIAGGALNSLGGGFNNFASIGGGLSNTIGSADGGVIAGGEMNNNQSYYSSILGGLGNSIPQNIGPAISLGGYFNTNSGVGSVILGGSTNKAIGRWSIAMGTHAWASNDYTFVWSGVDQVAMTTPTNSQHVVTATNGQYLNGPLWLNAMNTNGGIYILSNQFSLWAVTNSMPNFAHWWGPSNGNIIDIYYSNGVPFMKVLAP